MEGYSVSRWASVLHHSPHLQLTGEGLLSLSNHTFDWRRLAYTNSVLVTSLLPLAALLPVFALYILYILLLRRVAHKQTSLGRQRTCHGASAVLGLAVTGALLAGVLLCCLGLRRTDVALTELYSRSQHSRATIGQWSDYVRSKGSSNSLNRVALYRLNQTLAAYSARSDGSWLYWQSRFRLANYGLTGLDLVLVAWLGLFWLGLALLGRRPGLVRPFLLWAIASLVVSSLALSAHIGASLLLADFCLSAKPAIADMLVQGNSPSNLTRPFVEYYLHCDQWNLDRHTHTVLDYLDRFNSMLGSQLARWNLADQLQSNVNSTYQALTCRVLNPTINRALTDLCTLPVDGLVLTCLAYLLTSGLSVLLLFTVTFTL